MAKQIVCAYGARPRKSGMMMHESGARIFILSQFHLSVPINGTFFNWSSFSLTFSLRPPYPASRHRAD